MVIFFLFLYTAMFLILTNKNYNTVNNTSKILSIKQYELIRDTIDGAKK